MLRIALKDLRLFIKDRRAVVLTFFMPVALISIFAMAYGGEKEHNAHPISLLVSDLDQTDLSRSVVDQVDSNKNIEVKRLPVDSAERLVKTGEESAVLVFAKGFADSVREGKNAPVEMRYDPSKGPEVGILQQALAGSLAQIIMKSMTSGSSPQQAPVMDTSMEAKIRQVISEQAEKHSGQGLKMTALIEQKQNNPGLIHAVAGTAVMMLLFGLVAMGAGLLEEKENGTLKKLLYSPVSPNQILFGKMLASNVVAMVQLTVMFIYASYMFRLDLTMNTPALIVMMLTTSFACSGFGMFLASVAKSRQQVQMLSTLFVLSMSAIGGSMVPSFMMPAFMQKISVLSVNYWSIQGFYDIYWRNLAFNDPVFLMRPIMLVVIGAGMITLSMIFFRRNVMKLS
ncbi:MAG TPA: ABC transporter permease [Bacteroidia bacterium]|nr:ABC transporter permease [Bacteroidia bacterium]